MPKYIQPCRARFAKWTDVGKNNEQNDFLQGGMLEGDIGAFG